MFILCLLDQLISKMATVHQPWIQHPKPGVGGGGFTLRRRELSENLQRHHLAVGAAVPSVSTWNAEHVTLTTQARHKVCHCHAHSLTLFTHSCVC
jgi:hypothetical protein